MAQKQYHPSGSIAGFHSAYIEDTMPSIAQLQPPFTLGFCTTYHIIHPKNRVKAHLKVGITECH